jgi:hypothetical protein
MKRFLFILFCALNVYFSAAQTCDIQTPGIEASPFNIVVGQTSDLSFFVFNNANGGPCTYAVGSVWVVVSLPSNGLAYHSTVTPAGGVGAFFNWSYIPESNVFFGQNHTAIGDGQGEFVVFKVIGTTLPSYPQNRQVNINIIQNPGAPIFPSNNPGNDNGFTTITINAPLPVELLSFKADYRDCNMVELTWETGAEKNSDYFEIMRSSDGEEFDVIGKVNSGNKDTGEKYSFIDNRGLVPGQQYYYRLKQVDFDGRHEIFRIVSVKNLCEGSEGSFSLYPNPAFDEINIMLNGVKIIENTRLLISGAAGEVVKEIKLTSALSTHKIKLDSLPAGIYNVRLAGYESLGSKKFIKIN